jgi:bla regulator protein blaR1
MENYIMLLPQKKTIAKLPNTLAISLAFGLTCAAPLAQTNGLQISGAATASGQPSSWEALAGGHQEFEVASVRLSPPEAQTRGNDIISPVDERTFHGNRVSANVPLRSYIIFAYKLQDASQYQGLSDQLPKWAQDDHQFTIEARTALNATKDQMRLMMQSLLKERFSLSTHNETKDVAITAMTLNKSGKTGPALMPHTDKEPCTKKSASSPETDSTGVHLRYCGTQIWQADGELHIRMIDMPIGQIMTYLGMAGVSIGGMEKRLVVDHTGLSGNYDMDIQFVKTSLMGPEGDMGMQSNLGGRTFTEALMSQLGIKPVKQNGPVSILIIDHISMPSEN